LIVRGTAWERIPALGFRAPDSAAYKSVSSSRSEKRRVQQVVTALSYVEPKRCSQREKPHT